MKKMQLNLLAIAIVLAFSVSHASTATASSIKLLEHAKHNLSSDIERHAYRVTLDNGSKPTILLNLSPKKYASKDIRIPRRLSSEQIYSHPDFMATINENARLYSIANPGSKFTFDLKENGQLGYNYHGKNPKALRAYIDKMLKKTADQMMESVFHLKTDKKSKNILFDYNYAAKTQQHIANTLTRKLLKLQMSKKANEKLDILLSFVQSIPYDGSNMTNIAFRTPLAVLADHKGDCDEKSLLLSLMIKSALPNLKTALLLSKTGKDDHAITLIEWPYKRPGRLQIGNTYYLALETTAPQQIGYIPPIMIRALKDKQYKVISI